MGTTFQQGDLRGIYIETVRSKNTSREQFQIIGFGVIIPLDEVFETFVEVALREKCLNTGKYGPEKTRI